MTEGALSCDRIGFDLQNGCFLSFFLLFVLAGEQRLYWLAWGSSCPVVSSLPIIVPEWVLQRDIMFHYLFVTSSLNRVFAGW